MIARRIVEGQVNLDVLIEHVPHGRRSSARKLGPQKQVNGD
jgi:hypothetical protein